MIPDWLDFESYAKRAFCNTRGLERPSIPWGEMIAASQRVILEYEDYSPEQSELLLLEETPPLLAAARCLDAASRFQSDISLEHRVGLAVEAAVAYSMLGNFPSARAVIESNPGLREAASTTYAAILAVACPQLIPLTLNKQKDALSENESALLDAIQRALEDYSAKRYQEVMSRWEAVARDSLKRAGHKASLFRSTRTAIFHLSHLSTARTLASLREKLLPGHILALCRASRTTLLPSQYDAIVRKGLLASSANAVLSMPTGTGKTLLGQLCISAALGSSHGLAAYIAPYQALANQVYTSFKRELPKDVAVERAIGGYSPVNEISPGSSTVLVATPERFDAFLRAQPSLLKQLKAVVVDEAHMIEQAERGVGLESIVARLRLAQGATPSRIVLVSAVLSNLDRLRQWLGTSKEMLIQVSWRPTARRLAVWTQAGRLEYLATADPLESATAGTTIAQRPLQWPNWLPSHDGDFAGREKKVAKVAANVGALVAELLQQFEGPVLCVCASKQSTRQIAYGIAKGRPVAGKPGAFVRGLLSAIKSRHRHLKLLGWLLERGVAYHNGSLPGEVREQIESACERREIDIVTATTTLAEGVDLPFRCTVLVDWLFWRDEGQVPISPLLFRNIAGRSGRAGYFTEGDTVIYENPLGNLKYTQRKDRLAKIRSEIAAPKSILLRSPLEGLTVSRGAPQDRSLLADLSSHFTACVQENPRTDDLALAFGSNLLTATRDSQAIVSVLRKIEGEMVAAGPRSVATRASPMHLTEYGRACVQTGFSPRSCGEILDAVGDSKQVYGPGRNALLAQLLLASRDLPEIEQSDLTKMGEKGARFSAKIGDLPGVIESWLAGVPLEHMFADLPYARRSAKDPNVAEWLNGLEEPSAWDSDFDKFNEFVSSCLQRALTWLCRAVDRLSSYSARSLPITPAWPLAAAWLEKGVDSQCALDILERTSVASRTTATFIGRSLEALYGTRGLSLADYLDRLHRRLLGMDRGTAFKETALARVDPLNAYMVAERATEFKEALEWLTEEAGATYNRLKP